MSFVRGGTVNGSSIASTAEGVPSAHPVGKRRGDGRSRASPAGAPSATQRAMTRMSSSDRRRTSANSPWPGTAFHGGMVPPPSGPAQEAPRQRAAVIAAVDDDLAVDDDRGNAERIAVRLVVRRAIGD